MGARAGREHFEFLDGIRALCAIFVLLGHAWSQPSGGFYPERWMNLLGLSYAHLAVAVFIVLSGFVITYPITARGDELGSVVAFFKRRARRILPPYYAALLLSIPFILLTGQQLTGTIWDASVPLSSGQIASHLALIHSWPLGIDGGAIGYQFWSIAVEFQIYLLTPLLLASARRVGLPLVTVVCGLLAALVVVYLPGLKSASVWFVVLFLFGAGTGRIVFHHPERANVAGAVGLVITLATLGTVAKAGNAWFHAQKAWVDLCLGAGIALLIAGIARGELRPLPLLKRWLSFEPLVWIGTFSYSLYLVHAALLHAAWLCWRAWIHPGPKLMFACLLLTTPLIIFVAHRFFLAFERPFMKPAKASPKPSLVASPS